MPPRVAVFGAGAIGCWIGGRLSAAGADVTLIGRSRVLRRLWAGVPEARPRGGLRERGLPANGGGLLGAVVAAGALEIVLADTVPVAMPIHVVLPPGRFVAARTRALIDFLSDRFAQDPLLAEG